MPANRIFRAFAALLLGGCLIGAGASTALAASPQGRLSGVTAKPSEKRSKSTRKVTAKSTANIAVDNKKSKSRAAVGPSRSTAGSGPGSTGSGPSTGTGSTPTTPITETTPTTPVTPPTTPVTPTPPITETTTTTPVTPPTTPTPGETSGSMLFNGATVNDFWMQQAAPNAITEVPDPLGSGASVLKMTVNNNDVAPITPTDNPRAQLLSPEMLKPGQEFWMQEKFLIPSEMPSIPGWMSLMAIYGAPFNGTGPWNVEIANNELRWQRNGDYNWDIPWRTALVKGQWTTVTLHMMLATNGWVEMWINGQQIKFFSKGAYNPLKEAETSRLAMKTMDSSNDAGPNSARIMQYREAGMFQSGTVYFGALKVGATLSSVQ